MASADSFCAAYKRVILSVPDGAEVGKTALSVRQRIAANDTLYRCVCEKWKNPICKAPAAK